MASQLQFNYTGGASNANPDLSLGGTGSSVKLLTVALNNLFDNVLPSDIVTVDHVSYRAIDLYNFGDGSALHVDFYFTDTPNAESVLAAGLDAAATQSIVNDTTAPIGITFTEPTVSSRLSLPNLAAGAKHRLWIRRTVDQGATNINDDTAYLHNWYS
jgi:hypothetical protein